MPPVVFLGPSLPIGEARLLLGAEAIWRPPASRGDIYDAVKYGAGTVALIDGYFHATPAVGHKEILWALGRGARVFGAASMGALRAAELDSYGMVGVGEVYRHYADGTLMCDDEVAVLHAPAEMGYEPLTEALVDIRFTAALAASQGRASPGFARRVVDTAARLHFGARTWSRICAALFPAEAAGADDAEAFEWMRRNTVHQKQLDARELLARLATPDQSDAATPSFEFEDTWFFDRFRKLRDNPLTRDLA